MCVFWGIESILSANLSFAKGNIDWTVELAALGTLQFCELTIFVNTTVASIRRLH